jgi:hypothetical protein
MMVDWFLENKTNIGTRYELKDSVLHEFCAVWKDGTDWRFLHANDAKALSGGRFKTRRMAENEIKKIIN